MQLLSAISAARPERLQECILSAPLGVSRLVGILDDSKDAVRNAGLLLLVDLTSGAPEELRKIVVFEDVFGKVFALIHLEGGLAEAGITAQDCLSLLANLIKGSASNQTIFRESGCVKQYEQLLHEAFPPETPEAAFIAQSREKATWGLLQLMRLFLVPGDASTAQNQSAFFRAGISQVLVDIGFIAALPSTIRSSALKSAAALIEANPPLQEQFAALTVIDQVRNAQNADSSQAGPQVNGKRSSATSAKNSARTSADQKRTYIIEALLELCLEQSQALPALRSAACGLIQSYLAKHDRVKAHFIQRAIAGHAEHETAANILTTLLHSPESDVNAIVFASWILQEIITDNPDAKAALAAVIEGNENEGEDVVTSIQALGSLLQAELQTATADERLVAAYASLLTTLFWDFAQGVDNLFAEGSSLLQALLSAATNPSVDIVIGGLAAALLGTIYEFSTKDSPIPRRTLAPILQQKLGRPKYLDALLQLRRHPAIRDLDMDREADETGEHILSKGFVDLFALEYSRLRNAFDKDPGVEVLPLSAVEAGVNRDVLDDLRQQLQTTKDDLANVQQEIVTVVQKGEQDRMAAAKELQTTTAEAGRLRKINQSMQQGHEIELENVTKQHEQQREAVQSQHHTALEQTKQEVERQNQAVLRDRESAAAQKVQEYERRIAELGNAQRAEASAHATARQQLETLTTAHNQITARESSLSQQTQELQLRLDTSDRELQAAKSQLSKATADLEEARASLNTGSEDLQRLTAQISELQKELKSKEEELKTERAGFADLEKELEASKTGVSNSGDVDASKLASLEAELTEAKESEKSSKEELESMLLVMGDIEAKRDAYKAKVKDLGGEVTEEEDDDEEEDEASGEDEDEVD